MFKVSLGYLMPETWKLSKTIEITSKGLRNQLLRTPTAPTWENLRIKKNNLEWTETHQNVLKSKISYWYFKNKKNSLIILELASEPTDKSEH